MRSLPGCFQSVVAYFVDVVVILVIIVLVGINDVVAFVVL